MEVHEASSSNNLLLKSVPIGHRQLSYVQSLWKKPERTKQKTSHSFVEHEYFNQLQQCKAKNVTSPQEHHEYKKEKYRFLNMLGLKRKKKKRRKISGPISANQQKRIKCSQYFPAAKTGKLACPALGPGWHFEQVVRQQGKTAGTYDVYYYSPTKVRLRSKLKLQNFLGDKVSLNDFDYNLGRFLEKGEVIHKKDALFTDKVKLVDGRSGPGMNRKLHSTSLARKLKKKASKDSKIFSATKKKHKVSGFDAFTIDVLRASGSIRNKSYSIGKIVENGWSLLDPWKKSWYLNNTFIVMKKENVGKHKGAKAGRSKVSLKTFSSTRSKRCNSCSGCLASNCGKCTFCKDMPKNGGQGKMKQSCIRRRCAQFVVKGKDKSLSTLMETYPQCSEDRSKSVVVTGEDEKTVACLEPKKEPRLSVAPSSKGWNDIPTSSTCTSAKKNGNKKSSKSRRKTTHSCVRYKVNYKRDCPPTGREGLMESYADRSGSASTAAQDQRDMSESHKVPSNLFHPSTELDEKRDTEGVESKASRVTPPSQRCTEGEESKIPRSTPPPHGEKEISRASNQSIELSSCRDDVPTIAHGPANFVAESPADGSISKLPLLTSVSSLCNSPHGSSTLTNLALDEPGKNNPSIPFTTTAPSRPRVQHHEVDRTRSVMLHSVEDDLNYPMFASNNENVSGTLHSRALRTKSSITNSSSCPRSSVPAEKRMNENARHKLASSFADCENGSVELDPDQASTSLKPFVNRAKVLTLPAIGPFLQPSQLHQAQSKLISPLSSQLKRPNSDVYSFSRKLAKKSTSRKKHTCAQRNTTVLSTPSSHHFKTIVATAEASHKP